MWQPYLAVLITPLAAAGPPETAPSKFELSASGSYTLDLSTVVSGGLQRRSASRGLLEVGLAVDLTATGGTLFAGAQSIRGRNGSEDLGDFQGYSNIDAEPSDTLAELWFEQRLADDRVRFKVGSVDANSEFALVESALGFVNSSAGYSPSILSFPTYPDPQPSLNLFFDSNERLRLGVGVYRSTLSDDAANRDDTALFYIGELGLSWSSGRIALGAWHESGNLERSDGGIESGSWGEYAVLELRPSTALTLFAQLGRADQDVAEATLHASLGVVARGRVGAMLSFVDLSDAPNAGFEENETALELFYRFQVTRWLLLQPDLQYVLDPGGDAAVGNGVVATLRVVVSFE